MSLSLPLDWKPHEASVSFLLNILVITGYQFPLTIQISQICLIIRITLKDVDSEAQLGYSIRILRSGGREIYQKERLEIKCKYIMKGC